MSSIDISHTEEIYTVSGLNREIRFLLEGSFPALWVEGEISNFAAPNSGHWYFCIKDSAAQIRCALFRPQNRHLTFIPKDGMHVMLKARVSLYEGRGDFQLLVEHLEEIGEGKLRQEFEALKKRLLAAGLFDTAHKKPFPVFPNTIGIITSATGAALHDILSALKRRYTTAAVIIYPTLVQGEMAATEIVKAIQTANRRKECDALILARGGGSLEDLWPFNEERVALAIYQSDLPIVSGVGHEVDITIADFVADLRAATPTAAAELITPDKNDLLGTLSAAEKQLLRLTKQKLQQVQQQINWAQKHLQQQHPKHRLAEQTQQLDFYELTLVRLQMEKINERRTTLYKLHTRLQNCTPLPAMQRLLQQLHYEQQKLQNSMQQAVLRPQQRLANLAAKLDALSPLATLQRGFSIAVRCENQTILRNAQEILQGEKIQLRLAKGSLECTVDKINAS
jgi:exodeoxyribonuclease VII large subunit